MLYFEENGAIVNPHTNKKVTTFKNGDILILEKMPFDASINGKMCHATGTAEWSNGKWWTCFEEDEA